MKHLLNTLYITDPLVYLSLENENVVIHREDNPSAKLPLHLLETIICFGCKGVSPALMGACIDKGIYLALHDISGRFEAAVVSNVPGNVLLRREQYRIADDQKALEISKDFILAKVLNQKAVLLRYKRDYDVDTEAFEESIKGIKECLTNIPKADSRMELMGLEGKAANFYFMAFPVLVRKQLENPFYGRNRRPPKDPINALLSFFYTILASDVASACNAVGLDPYVGFLHVDRPGRRSLALDLEEELRAYMVDRFVLSQINRGQIKESDFIYDLGGACSLTSQAKKKILQNWQKRKQDIITHPFLQEQIELGLLPYVQAGLLARFIRGDLKRYPAFLWK